MTHQVVNTEKEQDYQSIVSPRADEAQTVAAQSPQPSVGQSEKRPGTIIVKPMRIHRYRRF